MQRHPGSATRSLRRKPGLSNMSLSDLSRTSTSVESAREPVQLETPPRSRTSSRGRPARSVDLSFQQMGFSEMTVYANTSSRMQYHISVHMNCFCPSSYITVVRRWQVDGKLIGSFEMGTSTQRAVANMYGTEKMLDSVLSMSGKKSDDRLWHWRWDDEPGHSLSWHREYPDRYCYFTDSTGHPSGPMIAAFSCQGKSAGFGGPFTQYSATLKIFARGFAVADHIIVSALVVERKRLTPTSMAANPIFN